MKNRKLDELIRNLGMQVEMQPLLESNANGETGYERFKRAVEDILNNYSGKKPTIKKKIRGYKRPGTNPNSVLDINFSRSNWYNQREFIPTIVEGHVSISNFEKALNYFRRNYGIG